MLRATRGWVVAGLLFGCQTSAGHEVAVHRDAGAARAPSTDPAAEDYPSPPLPHARVMVPDAYGGMHAVDVEVAATPASRERGLMWRNALAEGKGMLFIEPHELVQNFWMRNTLIPLDLFFIDKGLRIVGIVENAEPKTLTGRGVPYPSMYVLEVPGGWAARIGAHAGARVELQGTEGIDVKPGNP
jgi:uncharacterized membrane protein (UPF0127 family)